MSFKPYASIGMNSLLPLILIASVYGRPSVLQSDSNVTYVNNNRFTKISPGHSDFLEEICGKQRPLDNENEPRMKVAGGQRAWNGQFPWTVTLWWANKTESDQPDKGRFKQMCTGQLISGRHVLTAAHCLYHGYSLHASPDEKTIKYDVRVTAGGTCNFERDACKGDRFKKEKYTYDIRVKVIAVRNEIFEDNNLLPYDVAILELEEAIDFDNQVSPVCLPKINETYPLHSLLFQAGFGFDETGETSADLRFIRTDFYGEPVMNETGHKIETLVPLRAHPANKLDLGRMLGGDSGSGLIYYNEADKRFYSIGALSGHVLGSPLEQYTDLRYFVDQICESTGTCYMTKTPTEDYSEND